MNCECNNKSNRVKPGIKHVYGNVLRMAIPLTLRTLTKDGDEMVVTDTDFIPSSDHPVRVVFSRGKTNYPLIATMDGNVAIVEDKGKIPVGTYDISVECYDDLGNPYRFKQNAVLYVADTTAEAGIDEEIEYEAQTWYLNAAVFLATTEIGEIGDAIDAKLDDVFGNVAYDANAKEIRFYNKDNSRVLATIDSRPFIADGTVADVYIDVSRQVLVVVLNEDAGGTRFSVPLYLVFAEYYKKDEVDNLVSRTVEGLRFDFSQELPLVVPVTKNGSSYSSPVDFGVIENAIREDGRLVVACVNNDIFYQLLVADRAEIAFSRVVALDGYQELLIVDPHNVWSMEDVDLGTGGGGGYEPPAGGIPKTDLAPAVQASLAKADSALQSETDPTVPNWAKQSNKPTYNVSEIIYSSNRPLSLKLDEMTAEILAAGATDSEMSDSSKKPVQNKVIKAYVDAAVLTLQNALNALMNGQSVTDAIDTFNEIVDFLDGIDTDDPTLANQLLTLNNAINNAGKVKSVTINGTNHTPNSSGVVDLGTIQGAQGPKGDTGNVTVTDGVAQITIVNDLTTGGTGDALSAEMGKRLALMSGTYADAWARSKAITSPFCFLWIETVNGDAISKPIWHIGNSVFIDAAGAIINVTAAAVPDAPTITGATSGSTVPKNTQITITPASGSALYYSIDGGTTYNVSDASVTIKLETAGSVSIVAYCANNAGNSSNATLSVTVAGTAVPTFSPNGGEVARGGSVTISVPAGGELHYKVGSGSWQTASGTSASVQITGNTTIQAYNVQDGDTSSTITNNYTMAALASPTFSVATGTEFPATGGSVELTGPTGATIYYTTDGSTPTTSSTQYTGTAIAVASAMTIKAIAHDNYGSSAVAEASYSVTIDHKFVFRIKLSSDNSTEYVPVSHQAVPGFSSRNYTMSVDWGDGTVDNFTDKAFSAKGCSHAYTGAAGDEKTITLRGSAIPALYFAESASGAGADTFGNVEALVAILENTLTCDTYITINGGCSSLSADALSNNVGTGQLHLNGLASFPAGLLNHLSKTGITNFTDMFHSSEATFTAENMQELRTSLASATFMRSMFYGFKGTCPLPNNLFDLIGSGVVTSVWALMHTAKSGLTGDAKALYDVLSTKVTSSASTAYCFSPVSLTNRNQVPNAWGGTAS